MVASARDLDLNLRARALWTGRALRGVRPVVGVPISLGQTARIKLDPVGALTALILRLTLRVDIAGAVQVPGAWAPYGLLTKIRLVDTLGRARVNVTGVQAAIFQAIDDRLKGLGQAGYWYAYPLIPSAIGSNQLIDISWRIPIVADVDRDLRGLMYMPGEDQCNLFADLTDSLLTAGDDAALYKGALGTVALNATTQAPTLELWQEFLDGPDPLPQLDLATVHYLDGAQVLGNGLAAGAETLIDYPVRRSTRTVVINHLVNRTAGVDNLTQLRVLLRSNYDLARMTGSERIVQQRRELRGNDLLAGAWYWRSQPESYAGYARELQLGVTPAVTGTSQSIAFLFDNFGAP